MAHYRRKHSAVNTRSRYSPRARQTEWMNTWPAWWDIVFHRRPQRRRSRALENAVLRGYLDPDGIAWPLNRGKHRYYW